MSVTPPSCRFCDNDISTALCTCGAARDCSAASIEWCGKNEPHGRHEWLDGATRRDCPGSIGPSDAIASGGEQRGVHHGDADAGTSASRSRTSSEAVSPKGSAEPHHGIASDSTAASTERTTP